MKDLIIKTLIEDGPKTIKQMAVLLSEEPENIAITVEEMAGEKILSKSGAHSWQVSASHKKSMVSKKTEDEKKNTGHEDFELTPDEVPTIADIIQRMKDRLEPASVDRMEEKIEALQELAAIVEWPLSDLLTEIGEDLERI